MLIFKIQNRKTIFCFGHLNLLFKICLDFRIWNFEFSRPVDEGVANGRVETETLLNLLRGTAVKNLPQWPKG